MLALTLATVLAATPAQQVERIEEWAWQDAAQQAAQQAKEEKAAERHADDLRNDAEMGRKYAAEVDKSLRASEDGEMANRVRRIGAELAAIARVTPARVLWGDKRLNPFDYTFRLVQGTDVNAFSLPGGTIYVYEGLVKYAESDDEIAGVLAHEIAHAAFRHVATLQREESKISALQLPLILLGVLLGGAQGGQGGPNGQGANGQGAMAGIMGPLLLGQAMKSGWSVSAEEAADYGGFQYLLRSKYNPTGMLTFMERLARDERRGPQFDFGIFRTHPPGRERSESLQRFMAQAGIQVSRSAVASSFRVTARPGNAGTVDLVFGTRKLVSLAGDGAIERAEQAATRLSAFFDEMPEMFMVQVGADGTILGRRRPLLALTEADAAAAKTPLPALREATVKTIRLSLYNLAYRVWDR